MSSPLGQRLAWALDAVDDDEFAGALGRRELQPELPLDRDGENGGDAPGVSLFVGREIEMDVEASRQPGLVDDRAIEKRQDELDELVDGLPGRLDLRPADDDRAAAFGFELRGQVLREVDR